MITVSDITKTYSQAGRDIHALAGVSLHVPPATVHGVIGPSGAGKSTLVRCLALLEHPTSGHVQIDGVDLATADSQALRRARRRLGVVFQHANLFDSRRVVDNVAYPLEITGLSRAERRQKALELLELVGLADTADAYPSQLSGGQRQRVGIARALATDPDVLLCDEPTSALDPQTTHEILELIRSVRDRLGIAVLVITHEMTVVKQICDAVSLLDAGRIVESGPIEQVVGTFRSRLSESLLSLPPAADASDGVILDVLEALGPGGTSAFQQVQHRLGVSIPIVAGTIQTLGATTFHRLRIALPPGVDSEEVTEALRSHGAQAGLVLAASGGAA